MKKLTCALLPLILLIVIRQHAVAQSVARRWEPFACPFGNATNCVIECGYVTVPADHRHPGAGTVRLAVATIHSPSPQPDPVLFLAGGPGDSGVQRAPLTAAMLSELLKDRDVILFDQRGAGLSQTALACPRITPPIFADESEFRRTEHDVFACSQELSENNVDLSLVNTQQSAADVSLLPELLGYETINLLGVSYGTRLGLTVIAEHPERIRSAVLDSVTPLQVNVYDQVGFTFDHAFTQFERLCNVDLACRLFYPSIHEMHSHVYQRLDESPIIERVGEGDNARQQTITAQHLSQFVLMSLYSRETIGQLPALLRDFEAENYSALIEWLREMQPGDGSGVGMALSVMCADQGAYTTYERALTAQSAFPSAFSPDFGFFGSGGARLCASWGSDYATSGQNVAAASEVTTLLMSGSFDPVTPPEWARLAAETLPNSTVIEFAHVGHATIRTDCGQQTAALFLESPDNFTQAPCDVAPVNFQLSENVTRPIVGGLAIVFGMIAVWGGAMAIVAGLRRPYYFGTTAALKSTNIYWIVGSILLIAVVAFVDLASFLTFDAARIIEVVIPLMIGLQAAVVFSPDDEPSLELVATCPRGIGWVVVERWLGVVISQCGVALAGMILSIVLLPGQDLLIMLARWIPSAVLFSGLGIFITLRFRVAAFGLVLTGALWFVFLVFGDFFLPGGGELFAPLNYIQPFLWGIHPYMQPDNLSRTSYWINRACVAALGGALMTIAVRRLRDEEQVLLGGRKKA